MEKLKYIVIIGILIFNNCSNSKDYQIESKFKSIVNNDNCEVEFIYPNFVSSNAKIDVNDLNEILEKYVDYEQYSHGCDDEKNEKKIITGNYQITLMTNDILSIEFITQVIRYGNNQMDTIYHSLVLNPKKIGDKEFSYFQPDPKFLIPNFDRGSLYKYVEEYNENNDNKVNLLAYESESKYVITWGVSENNFLLYVGGEGEWFGFDKILIPIDELRKENNS